MAGRVWAWLRKKRISWLDVICITFLWVTSTIVQYFTGWNETVAVLVTCGCFLAAVCMVAAVHGAWESIRGH